MPEFKAITTQEDFDAAMEECLKKERETAEKKYEGWLSPEDVSKKYEGWLSPEELSKKYEKWVSPEDAAEKEAEIKKYKIDSAKIKIAHETGLGYEAVGFIQGEDEEAIKKSAKALKDMIGPGNNAPPLYTTEPSGDGKKQRETEAFKTMLADMKGE